MKIFKKLNLLYSIEDFWSKDNIENKGEKSKEDLNNLSDNQMEEIAPNSKEFASFKDEMEGLNWAEKSEVLEETAETKKWLNSMMDAILAQSWMSKEKFEASNQFA